MRETAVKGRDANSAARMTRILIAFFLVVHGSSLTAQYTGRVAESIIALREQGAAFPSRALFQPVQRSANTETRWSSALAEAEALLLDERASAAILSERPTHFAMGLPSSEGTITLDLERVELFTSDFQVTQASSNAAYSMGLGVHYRGMIRGVPGSLAAISVFNHEVMGLVSDSEGDRVLGRLADGSDGMHVFYREQDLLVPHSASCGTVDDGAVYDPSIILAEGAPKTDKCVRFYWEVNYDIFQGKGGVVNATNYVTGLFNQSAILYANDGISVVLSEVFVWDVPSPYVHASTGDQLDQFGVTRTSFNGDLAHLLGYTGGGGIAWLNTLCNSQARLRMAYSDINSTYSNVPTYSWSVEVVTHEQGHNMGSKHTHACAWNGNNTAIDGCGPAAGYTEGTCAQGPLPSSSVGGTIMSYCHLTSSTIKFANGFGPQPTALIVNKVNTSACLTTCAASCGTPTGLSAGSITASSAALSWTAVSGAVTYNLHWKLASAGTWTTVSGITATSHPLSGLAANSTYSFQVQAVCSGGSSSYAAAVNFTTSAPACAVPAGLVASSISASGALLSWGAVSGAVSYNVRWKPATGSTWTTVSNVAGTNHAVSGLSAATTYNFQVKSTCSGSSSGYSASSNFTTAQAACADPSEPNETQATAPVVVPSATLTRLISSSTDLDWFRFANSSAAKSIRVRLIDLPADYNLRVYKGTTLKGSSSLAGTASETVILNNPSVASNFYARVNGASGAFNASACYTIIIETSATPFAMPEGMTEAAEVEDEASSYILLPNPANDLVATMIPAHHGVASIELLDALGRLLDQRSLGASDVPTRVEFSVAERNEGIYLVRVSADGETETQRLVVTH